MRFFSQLTPRRRLLGALALLVALVALPALALAHPMGDFAISRYSRLDLLVDQVRVLYVVDMAEIPTFQEIERADSNGDARLDEVEAAAYLADLAPRLVANLSLRVGGESAEFTLIDQAVSFPPGNGGLDTTRIELILTAPLSPQPSAWEVDYQDNNYADRIGWKEVVIQAQDGVVLLASSAPTEDLTDALRTYPEEVMLDTSSAVLRFEPLGLSGATESIAVPATLGGGDITIAGSASDQRFADLINTQLSNPGVVAGVIVYALFAGAAHALTPGHGKTIVAAYLVGSRGSIGHALFLGLTTTVTHTLGVFAVGLITLFASQYILPEQLFPWIGVFSGLLVVAIGWSLFRGRLAGASAPDAGHSSLEDHSAVEYVDGTLIHSHGGGPAHSHMPPTSAQGISWGNLFALGVSGGLLPCPSALVLMLAAISVQRVGFGLLLIVIFSVGLAGVLTGIGIMWVKARDLVNRFSGENSLLARIPYGERALQLLPAASAAFITVAGIIITWQALLQTGLI